MVGGLGNEGMGYGLGRLWLPLTPSASAAALGHKNMQAYFCDARFARYWGMGYCN